MHIQVCILAEWASVRFRHSTNTRTQRNRRWPRLSELLKHRPPSHRAVCECFSPPLLLRHPIFCLFGVPVYVWVYVVRWCSCASCCFCSSLFFSFIRSPRSAYICMKVAVHRFQLCLVSLAHICDDVVDVQVTLMSRRAKKDGKL